MYIRIVFLLSAALAVSAQSQQAIREVFATGANVAIDGYDAVAYRTEAKPMKGSPQHALQWKGATWHFSSEANRRLFEAEPEKYTPQYGGYCAFGMSRGYKAKVDPEAWSIVGGKLYLNYNQSVRTTWLEETAEFIAKADAAWPSVKFSAKPVR
jgi:YHS domain-containing protein